jgi:hypothetical protein
VLDVDVVGRCDANARAGGHAGELPLVGFHRQPSQFCGVTGFAPRQVSDSSRRSHGTS